MSGEVTQMLEAMAEGDPDAVNRLMPLVYAQIRALAASQMRAERADHTLQPTALAHEAYLRLVGEQQVRWENRAQFMAIAARCIRQILVNHANAHNAAKRGGGAARIPLDDARLPVAGRVDTGGVEAGDLERLLTTLAELNERQAQVVELRFYGGLGVEEVAAVLRVSPRTVENDWRFARAWLATRLTEKSRSA